MNPPPRYGKRQHCANKDFWFLLNGLTVVAVVATVPTLFNAVVARSLNPRHREDPLQLVRETPALLQQGGGLDAPIRSISITPLLMICR